MINVSNTKGSDWLWLLLAVVVTMLLLFFAEPIYTCLYPGTDEFFNQMIDHNLYFINALGTAIVVWAINILYYWIIDSVSLSKFMMWFLFMLLAVVIAPLWVYAYPENVFAADEIDSLSQENMLMALVNIVITVVLFIVVSIGIKRFSTNCTTRPF